MLYEIIKISIIGGVILGLIEGIHTFIRIFFNEV